MSSLVTKSLKTGVLILGLALPALFLKAAYSESPLVFESLESKAANGKAVFNRVRWVAGENQDVWLMQQSHDGVKSSPHTWDKVAIVIDKTQSPMEAQFFQLEPGPLVWAKSQKQIPLKATCFTCHPNGLRVLRPNLESDVSRLGAFDKAKLLVWNLRIKAYGRVLAKQAQLASGSKPFRWPHPEYNEALSLKACTLCHKESGLGARGSLTRQNASTIRFMVDQGLMPPFGLPFSEGDKKALEHFLEVPRPRRLAVKTESKK